MYTLTKWTLDDYHRMIEAGILDNRRVELLNGEIVEMPPEQPIHADSNTDARDYLITMLGHRAKVREQHPITLPNNSELEPDLAIVRRQDYSQHHPYSEDIYWLIEYANSSFKIDTEIKTKIYAAAGVREYWVVDLKRSLLLVYTQPEGERYLKKAELDTRSTTKASAFPDLEIEVRKIVG